MFLTAGARGEGNHSELFIIFIPVYATFDLNGVQGTGALHGVISTRYNYHIIERTSPGLVIEHPQKDRKFRPEVNDDKWKNPGYWSPGKAGTFTPAAHA
jgi:hypothetical protein